MLELYKKRRLNQIGDTIVEVLIVLLVLGSALGLAYATANRSIQGGRQAQEHNEALGALQSQLEEVRYLVSAGSINSANLPAGHFCITGTAPSLAVVLSSDPTCTQGFYHIDIAYSLAPREVFTLHASWEDIATHNQDDATLSYGLHVP